MDDDLARDMAVAREILSVRVPRVVLQTGTSTPASLLYWMGESDALGEPPPATPAPSVEEGLVALRKALLAADVGQTLDAFRNLKGPLSDAAVVAGNQEAADYIQGIDVQNPTPQIAILARAQDAVSEITSVVDPLTTALAAKTPVPETVRDALVGVVRFLRDVCRLIGWTDGILQFDGLLPVGG